MNEAVLKSVILEQNNEESRFSAEWVVREKLADIKPFLKIPHAVIISGIRRTGKSTLLAQILESTTRYSKEHVYYLSFEDERLLEFTVRDFQKLLEIFIELYGHRKIFFLDEIQNIPQWELFVRRMMEQGYKFFITGSNASMLSKELGTRLTGRFVMIELLPFSFREYLAFHQINYHPDDLYYTQKRAGLKKVFHQYLKFGSMPEYLKYQNMSLLKRAYEDILYRDVMTRHDISNEKILRELGLFLMSNIGNLISYNKTKSLLQLGSVNTVKNYIQYFEDAYLFFTVNLYSCSVKQQLIAPKKIYVIDNGIAESVAFQFSQNEGRYLENLVYIELKRRVSSKDIFYYKTKQNYEIDFLIRENNRITLLLQVTYQMHEKTTREREIKALVSAMEETDCQSGIILTLDQQEEITVQGKKIKVLPVYQWLLLNH